jgi:hypothetical protein
MLDATTGVVGTSPRRGTPDQHPDRGTKSAIRGGFASRRFARARATFEAGESEWVPLMILAIGYAIVLPVFLLMLGLDLAAYYLAGGS